MRTVLDFKKPLQAVPAYPQDLSGLVKHKCIKHGEYLGLEGEGICLDCESEKSAAKLSEKWKKAEEDKRKERWQRCGIPKKFCGITLDDWVAKSSADEKVKSKAIAFCQGDFKRMLIIGNCGTGKTMLAAGIVGEMAKVSDTVVFTTATRLIRKIRDSWRSKTTTEQDVMDSFIFMDLLIVDELGAGRCSEDDKLMLSEILCERYAENLPTILISNLTSSEIKASVLDERATDRIKEDGVVVAVKGESKRVLKLS